MIKSKRGISLWIWILIILIIIIILGLGFYFILASVDTNIMTSTTNSIPKPPALPS